MFAVNAALILGGCASAPTVDLRLPAAYESVGVTGPRAAEPAGAGDLDRWWTQFDDPRLSGLVEAALLRNLDARTALARLQEARATRSAALTGFLPQGDLSGAATRAGGADRAVTTTQTADFDVSWQLDLFGRFGASRAAANADLAAERFAFEGARANVAAQVADAYFQARGLAIQLADAQQAERVQGELYDLVTRKARRGLVAAGDADRVAGDLSQSTARVAGLQSELQAQKRALLILAGRVVEPTEALDIEAGVGRAPDAPATLPSALLLRRPDVREAQARLAAAVGRDQLADLAFLPTVTLIPGAGWSRTSATGVRNSGSTWTLGASASQPLLDIPRLVAQRRVSRARTEQAALAYEQVVATAFQESEGALVRLQSDRRQVEVLVEGERRAERAYRYARNNYGRGVTDLEATLSAEQAWRTTRAQLTTAQVQALRRAVQAYQALGGGWPAETFPTMANAR